MKKLFKLTSLLVLSLTAFSASAGIIPLTFNTYYTYDELDGPKNIIRVINLNLASGMPDGDEVIIDGIGWDVNIETVGDSWLSESSLELDDGSLYLTPGIGFDYSGNENFSSDGIIYLNDIGIENIILANGVLTVEFYETFDDGLLELDSIFSGTIYISTIMASPVPVPAAFWLMTTALASFGALGRRRKQAC